MPHCCCGIPYTATCRCWDRVAPYPNFFVLCQDLSRWVSVVLRPLEASVTRIPPKAGSTPIRGFSSGPKGEYSNLSLSSIFSEVSHRMRDTTNANLMLTDKIRKDILKKNKESYMAEGIVHK